MKIRLVGAELFHADGRTTDRHDEAKSRFSQFCIRAEKFCLYKFEEDRKKILVYREDKAFTAGLNKP
jgi:hypothetical protein